MFTKCLMFIQITFKNGFSLNKVKLQSYNKQTSFVWSVSFKVNGEWKRQGAKILKQQGGPFAKYEADFENMCVGGGN